MVDAWYEEWFTLVIRWFHFMMGVAWIGASFYFVWLNNAVRPPKEDAPGVSGEVWSVHGGAFYQVRKYAGAPPKLPEVLHWFKWEAYLTWLSGFTLLVLLWWTKADTMMINPSGFPLTAWQAVGVGAASLLGGWLVYDGLCRSPLKNHSGVLGALLFGFVSAVSYGLSRLLGGHAAYMHVGAMLGTWMVGNVAMVIIPGQRAIVNALIAGTPPPLERGKAGALRSLHNNYITLPVLFIMVSGHFPNTWGQPYGWAILLALGLIGAGYRHSVNLEERGQHVRWILPVLAVGLLSLAFVTKPAPAHNVGGPAVSITRVQQIVGERCITCHAEQPLQKGIGSPPKGVVLQTPAQILALKDRIVQQVVVSKAMPLGNITHITDGEREEIAQWAAGIP